MAMEPRGVSTIQEDVPDAEWRRILFTGVLVWRLKDPWAGLEEFGWCSVVFWERRDSRMKDTSL